MIKIIAGIVLAMDALGMLVYIKKSVTDKKTSDRVINLLLGVPVNFMKAYLAWYVIANM